MKTLASAGFSYIVKFIWFIVLALAINITLALIYWGNISALFSGENIWLGLITLATVTIFPIVWFIMAQQEALLSAIFKVVDRHLPDLVGFIVDKFLTGSKKEKVADVTGVLNKQSKVTQLILEFFFEKIDFFGEVSQLLKEKDYSNKELTDKMVERIEEKELFEEWKPSFMTALLLSIVNVGIVILASKFL